MKPSNFLKHPYDSVLQHTEDEVVARNIMVILNRTGNIFRDLSWDEYKQERLKDENFSHLEQTSFNKVIKYCQTATDAKKFSKVWDS